ncbi:MAG: DUF2461 domain-containing protein [Spirochaetia bacterium]
MEDAIDLGPVLDFLARLRKNNNKPWFDKNREQYESAMAQFESLVARLMSDLGKIEDFSGVTPKDCIMRIYRDVRFSKDKTPYKTGLGAGIVPGGRKSGRLGYHVHLAPNGETMIAGGLWEPTPPQLSRFRDAISRDASRFKEILQSGAFRRHFGQLTGEKVKTVPQGFSRDHPEIELLRHKQVCVSESFADAAVLSPRFPAEAAESLRAMKPFIDYLNKIIL